jgi:hypothetical protein
MLGSGIKGEKAQEGFGYSGLDFKFLFFFFVFETGSHHSPGFAFNSLYSDLPALPS